MLEGIQLDDRVSFRDWATELLPWLNDVMKDVNHGMGDSLEEVKERQIRYTSYAARLVELLAVAEGYYQTALAEAMEKLGTGPDKLSPMLVGRIAEGKVKNEAKVYAAIKRLNGALEILLMSIASRLRFEKNVNFGAQESTPLFMRD